MARIFRAERLVLSRPGAALVEPHVGLLAKNSRDSLAAQIDPLIGRPVKPIWRVLQAFRRDFNDGLVDGGFAVFDFDGNRAPCAIAATVLPSVSRLRIEAMKEANALPCFVSSGFPRGSR